MIAARTVERRLKGLWSAGLVAVVMLFASPASESAADAEQRATVSPSPYLSALFPRSEEFDFEPPTPGSYELPPLKMAPDGVVIDHKGGDRRLSKVLGDRISLVSFVYLMCGDTQGCPLAISTLFDIYETSAAAPELRKDVQLVTLSFDPERDTREAIESFSYPMLVDDAADKKLDWHVLTTRGQKDLKPILDGFGQAVDRSGDGETIKHLLRMFLVDRQGRIRNVYGLGMIDPRLLMADVETLLMEERQQ